ncbi:MAG: ATP-dependent DNA ligase [candidate division Zixibacteria bacterium]|nr:ATP-dependent DNA ligase [candidate division Zixibacteria bacterium]
MAVETILENLPDKQKAKIKHGSQPEWTFPMLAKLTHDYFSDEEWIYERKFDGERCLVFKKGENARLMSRNRKDISDTYPEVEEEFSKQGADFVVDGEIVAFSGDVTSFSRLQERMKIKDRDEAWKSNVAVYYYAFDLIHIGDYDITGVNLRHRKSLLRKALEFTNRVRFTAHRNKNGEEYHKEACRKGWEGIIAKNAASEYLHSRSGKWLKFKCANQQEFVIGGYTEPRGERIGFGAILIGYYEGGSLRYAGKVGTGYDDATLKDLKSKFNARERKTSSFDSPPSESNIHWLKPDLVAEIGFTEWTDGGKLRHPRYLGLRRDKSAKNVVREG